MASRAPIQVQDQNSELCIKGGTEMLSGSKAYQKRGQVVRRALTNITNVNNSVTTNTSKTNQPKKKSARAVVVDKGSKISVLQDAQAVSRSNTFCSSAERENFHFAGTDMEHYQKKMREKCVEKEVQQVMSSFRSLHIWPESCQNEVSCERQYCLETKLEWGDSPIRQSPLQPAENDPCAYDECFQLTLERSAISSLRPPF